MVELLRGEMCYLNNSSPGVPEKFRPAIKKHPQGILADVQESNAMIR